MTSGVRGRKKSLGLPGGSSCPQTLDQARARLLPCHPDPWSQQRLALGALGEVHGTLSCVCSSSVKPEIFPDQKGENKNQPHQRVLSSWKLPATDPARWKDLAPPLSGVCPGKGTCFSCPSPSPRTRTEKVHGLDSTARGRDRTQTRMGPASQMGWKHELSQALTSHLTWETGPSQCLLSMAQSCSVRGQSRQALSAPPAHRDGQEGALSLPLPTSTGLSDPHLEMTGSRLHISKEPVHGLHRALFGASE